MSYDLCRHTRTLYSWSTHMQGTSFHCNGSVILITIQPFRQPHVIARPRGSCAMHLHLPCQLPRALLIARFVCSNRWAFEQACPRNNFTLTDHSAASARQ
eukprot:6209541-Pleurochrysis_carterae.AAC.1